MGRSRTSVLNELMKDFIIEKGKSLAIRMKDLEMIDNAIRESHARMP